MGFPSGTQYLNGYTLVNMARTPLYSPTYPTWYSGIGRTVGSRATLGYWWDSTGQSHLSYVDTGHVTNVGQVGNILDVHSYPMDMLDNPVWTQ